MIVLYFIVVCFRVFVLSPCSFEDINTLFVLLALCLVSLFKILSKLVL